MCVVAGLLALLDLEGRPPGQGRAKLGGGKTPPAPAFALSRLDAPGKLALGSLRGKVVVLNFWASWCAPCKSEAPRLEAAWQQYRGKGVVVVGVDAQDFSGDAKRFMRKYKLTYPNVHDGPGNVLPKYGVTGFPETYFVDRRGRLVGDRVEGEITRREADRGHPARPAVVRLVLAAAGARPGAGGAGCGERAPPDPRRARGRGDVPHLQDDARPVDRADREPDPAVHHRADRGRRHEEPDQGQARRPVRAGDSRGAVEARVQPARVGAAVLWRSGSALRSLAWLVWRWSRRRESVVVAAGGAPLDPELERRLDDELARFDA